MFKWKSYDPQMKLVDALRVEVPKDSTITISEALSRWQKSDKCLYPVVVEDANKGILRIIEGTRSLTSLRVKDGMHIFETVLKQNDATRAMRLRAVFINAVRFALTGETPKAYAPRKPGLPSEDEAPLKFAAIKTSDMRALMPLYSIKGRFAATKAEVQKMVFSLPPDQSGTISAPRKSMDLKEANLIETEIMDMFKTNNLPWIIRYNPAESAFLLMRKKDFNSLFQQMSKGGANNGE